MNAHPILQARDPERVRRALELMLPPNADELITARLKEALALVDVRVLDHAIVAGGGCVALAESGHL